MGREEVMEEKLENSLEEKKAENLQLGAWQAAGVAALLQERGLKALESEDFERAYLYFLFALQFQPFRGVSRRKAIELMPFQKEREALMKEVEGLVQEVMAWKEGEKLPSVRCPVCGLSSPFGVRKCLCGYEFVPKQMPPLEISPSTSFKGVFAGLLLALFVLVGFQYYQIQSLKRSIVQTLEKQQQKQKQWKELGKKIEENQDILTGLVTNMAEVIERLDQLQMKEKGEQKKEK